MLYFGLAIACATGNAGAQNPAPLRENFPVVNRGVIEFFKIKNSGDFDGFVTEIKKCWANIEIRKTQEAIAFCFSLDYSTSTFDELAATRTNVPQSDFTKIEKTLTRVNKALKELKDDQDKRGQLISGWTIAANTMLPFYAKRNGNTAPIASKTENEILFSRVRDAIIGIVKSQNILQFQKFEHLMTPNLNGEPIEVVCGEIKIQSLSSGKVGVRPFAYFLADRTSYYDSGLPGADDLDAYVIKNFCG